jgi:undecaprenyl pyrophosphate phosphatase UppP
MGKISDTEREVIYLEIEKSKINREKSKIVLNKSLVLYITFTIVGIMGFAFDYIDSFLLNVLVVIGIVVLIIGIVPYHMITHKEEKKINELLNKFKRKK